MTSATPSTSSWQPVGRRERFLVLDLIRGFALFGVLLINLLYFFRISLFTHFVQPDEHRGPLSEAVSFAANHLLEFKAFDLFSGTFGIGLALQYTRARQRGIAGELFLIRRLLFLLLVGLLHLTLISNVDILTLYAVCGLLLLPLLRLPGWLLVVIGIAAIWGPSLIPMWPPLPPQSELAAHAARATQVYRESGFLALVPFRWDETQRWLLPLLLGVAQKTYGVMSLGVVFGRSRLLSPTAHERRWLGLLAFPLAAFGALTESWLNNAHLSIAAAYACLLLSWQPPAWIAPVAAAGQMAFTNYLVQSLVFGFVFYGYGLGLFGQLSTTPAAAFGLLFYLSQLAFSNWWLKRFRFGPLEWVWRSATYGRWQPLKLQIDSDNRSSL